MNTSTRYLAIHQQPNDLALMLMLNEDGTWVWTSDIDEATKFPTAEAAARAVGAFEQHCHERSHYATWYDTRATRIEGHKHV